MSVKVAIYGMGKVGRKLFFKAFESEGFECVLIADPTHNAEEIADLLEYELPNKEYHTIIGSYDYITIDGKSISVYTTLQSNIAELPCGSIGVDVFINCLGDYASSGDFDSLIAAPINAGAKKSIIVASEELGFGTGNYQNIICGINHGSISGSKFVLPQASVIAGSFLVKIAQNSLYFKDGWIEVLRNNLTGTLGNSFNGGPSIINGIVPQYIQTGKCIGRVLTSPATAGALLSYSYAYPTESGSFLTLRANCTSPYLTIEGINAAMKAGQSENFLYSDDQLLSSAPLCFGTDKEGAPVFLASLTGYMTTFSNNYGNYKLVVWYDEVSLVAAQALRLAYYAANA